MLIMFSQKGPWLIRTLELFLKLTYPRKPGATIGKVDQAKEKTAFHSNIPGLPLPNMNKIQSPLSLQFLIEACQRFENGVEIISRKIINEKHLQYRRADNYEYCPIVIY